MARERDAAKAAAVALNFSGPMLQEAMGLGAAAGAASTVTALQSGTAIAGPLGVLTAQALLKVVTGALTGWLGVLLMVFGGISALKVQGPGETPACTGVPVRRKKGVLRSELRLVRRLQFPVSAP